MIGQGLCFRCQCMPVAGKLEINEASDVAAIIRGEVAQNVVPAKSNSVLVPNM